jgi:sec-independent protein translocase protein TatA
MIPHLGPTELIVILVIVLLIFGAGKLPEVGSALGRGIKEFKKATTDESQPEIGSGSARSVSSAVTPPPVAAEVRNGQSCGRCGVQVAADARFCPKCGSSMPTAAA